jgi:hypothetical protein
MHTRSLKESARMERCVCAAGMLAISGLVGCSQTCTQAAVVGKYMMRSRSDTYELRLSNDGTGTLSRNGEPMERLTGEWGSSSEQVFLHVSRAVIGRLLALIGRATPAGVANFRGGYFWPKPTVQIRFGKSASDRR